MARGSSKSSGSTGNRRGATGSEDTRPDSLLPDTNPSDTAATRADSVTPDQDDSVAAQDSGRDGPQEGAQDMATGDVALTGDAPADTQSDTLSDTPARDDTLMADIAAASAPDAPAPTTEDTPPRPAPVPPPAPARQGGLVPLVLGGVIAAGIGYGAAYMGYLPVPGNAPQATVPDQSAAVADLAAQLAAMETRIDTLAQTASAAPAMPDTDLSTLIDPVNDQIAAIAPRVEAAEATLTTLADRVTALEARPAFGGDLPPDTAAALETATRLEAELAQERAAAEAQAADLAAQAEAAATAAAAAEAAAQAAIAQAEADTAAAVARAAAEAALGQVQVALETGQPFVEPLAALSDVADVPEALTAAAATGVPTLETLQTAFPALARAALPLAIQETAGDGLGDRLGAFVMGQVGGRSVEPRAGDDPDAVLSRIEAALRGGDLQTALTESAGLPDGARAILAPWVADVEARAGALAGLAALTTALTGTGN